MDTVVETLHQAARPVLRPNKKSGYIRPVKRKRVARWFHLTELSQAYPAVTEPGWRSVATGLPEEELFTIVIKIPPKQPDESFKALEKRFNKICRTERAEYVQNLKAQQWETPPPNRDFTWIDRLAQWQAGRSSSEIDPSIKTPSQRSSFSRRIKAAGQYIGITPRLSKHNPKRRPGH
jgi:hypothetical protein